MLTYVEADFRRKRNTAHNNSAKYSTKSTYSVCSVRIQWFDSMSKGMNISWKCSQAQAIQVD